MSGTGFCSNLATVSEKALLKNFLCDQKKIWTAPFRSGTYQWRIVLPLAGGTAALIATDKLSGRELTEGPPGAVFNASRRISYMGSAAGVLGFAGAFYGISRLTHNRRMRETALLSAEALADVAVLSAVMKAVSQRQRPSGSDGLYRINDARGEFWAGGNSFPSLHAGSVWALAAVFASRYRDKPVIKFGAYGLAAMISVSRMTARQHFPSDVLVGSVIGYFIGRYVARANRH
jgi:membrane-associated phospholipid phosphatase